MPHRNVSVIIHFGYNAIQNGGKPVASVTCTACRRYRRAREDEALAMENLGAAAQRHLSPSGHAAAVGEQIARLNCQCAERQAWKR